MKDYSESSMTTIGGVCITDLSESLGPAVEAVTVAGFFLAGIRDSMSFMLIPRFSGLLVLTALVTPPLQS